MSNRNNNLVNNGTENKQATAADKAKERFITINWRKIGRTVGKFTIAGCALVGAAGIGSYAADCIHSGRASKKQVPEAPVGTTTTDV